jgi:hypothetical protein
VTGWRPVAADYRLPIAMVLSIPLVGAAPLAIGFLIMSTQQWVEERRCAERRAADPFSQYLPASYLERCDRDRERVGWRVLLFSALMLIALAPWAILSVPRHCAVFHDEDWTSGPAGDIGVPVVAIREEL